MNDQDVDHLLERSLSDDPPSQAFRAQVLRASSSLFVLTRRRRVRWRLMAFRTAAAVLIAGISFLGGRYSVMRRSTEAPPGSPPVATAVPHADGTVVVSSELIAWVHAARLFKQLGMEDRVGRALDRAGRLMPPDASDLEPAFTGVDGECRPDQRESLSLTNRIMAKSLGD